ncbi:phosphoribosylamine--glycine ligase [Bacillus sp. ISL-40]|uniref:phosphoribosylamine--glycine ligase n=1 Tax=unclassified Bacillus (in: firmicutes) TaxID=185979 RepID=UPI001BEB663B|nr:MULTISPECIES: phosphoribosylamine--glycine ligase [unclassified Bacillus (in: firmicutes)]MBT2698703.1 phosphoribosylamine--glycine ligase [Bacillus sp. ISL-40]MBT2744685.1 phosphoribosylamine--glycine ligase [Bacillus sp. ISL-77]
MKVLVVGGGGREHAIVWKLSQSPKIKKMYCAPGNPGIAELAECVSIAVSEIEELADFAKKEQIDLTFVGPEEPLSLGIVNYFKEQGLPVYGPSKEAAMIEGSKEFAKELMMKYEIPTAKYASFSNYEEALTYVRSEGAPIVIKADGLAAGKGVVVAKKLEEAEKALKSMLKEVTFGSAGARVVVEEYLEGEEMTLLAFVNGTVVKPMVPAQDHKPVYDDDKGPNTGGMGTYAPLPHINSSMVERVIEDIVQPTAKAMAAEGCPFEGILYTGLMLTKEGPKVIEYNARFGDPETQVVLPLLETDLLDILLASLTGELENVEVKWKEKSAVCVIMSSAGYPGPYEKGQVINGLDQIAYPTIVFHAGTTQEKGAIVTNGGRVLGITAIGENLGQARELAYQSVEKVSFTGAHYRTDIGSKAFR